MVSSAVTTARSSNPPLVVLTGHVHLEQAPDHERPPGPPPSKAPSPVGASPPSGSSRTADPRAGPCSAGGGRSCATPPPPGPPPPPSPPAPGSGSPPADGGPALNAARRPLGRMTLGHRHDPDVVHPTRPLLRPSDPVPDLLERTLQPAVPHGRISYAPTGQRSTPGTPKHTRQEGDLAASGQVPLDSAGGCREAPTGSRT
jgi:hypothetical protein